MEVYGLSEPDTSALRYVGWAKDTDLRLKKHLEPGQLVPVTHKTAWIKSLLARGLKPVAQVIEKFETMDEAKTAEVFYIKFFRDRGADLTNGTAGGDGGAMNAEAREKHRQKMLGRKHSPETKLKMSLAHKGRVATAQARQNMSAAQGSPEARAKQRSAQLTAQNRPEQIALQRKLQTGRKHSSTTKAKMVASWEVRRNLSRKQDIFTR